MKVALVQCPAWTTESPPYALALLVVALEKSGHEVICFDLNIELYRFCKEIMKQDDSIISDESWSMDFRGYAWYEKEKVLNFINEYEPYINKLIDSIVNSPAQIIGFSVQSTSKFSSLEIARRIKERDKSKIIVFGGPLCFRNCYGIGILKDFQFLDFVCFGEGEELFPQLINTIEKEGKVQYSGFGSRMENNIIVDGGDGKLIKDLDRIPFADYSKFSLEKYAKKLLPIATSRGCINRCSFCNESTHWRKYRRRSAQNTLEEIKYQLELYPEIETFWFNDSLINGDIGLLNELCDLLISNKVKVKWGGQGTICKEMTKDLLRKMKLAGCNLISYGVESGSSKILRLMRKDYYTPELAKEIIRSTFEVGIDTIFNIIVGFPGETEDDFEETKDFVRECKRYTIHIELPTFLLLKGSYVYNHLDEFNILPIEYSDPDWQLKWQTKDNLNTYDLRKRRLEELKKIISE